MPSQVSPMQFKHQAVIHFETNYNNKLACDHMIHIDQAPGSPLLESVITSTSIRIKTRDGSIEPTDWILVDLLRLPLYQVNSYMTWQSHGLDQFEFAKMILNKFSSSNTYFPVAVYFYRRLRFED